MDFQLTIQCLPAILCSVILDRVISVHYYNYPYHAMISKDHCDNIMIDFQSLQIFSRLRFLPNESIGIEFIRPEHYTKLWHLLATFSEDAAIYLYNAPQRTSYQIRKLRVSHAPGMSGTFSPPHRVSVPDIYHGTCVMHVAWCMSGSLTSCFLWSRRRGIRSRHSRRMHNPQILRTC